MDISSIIDKVKAKTPSAEPPTDEGGGDATEGDHKARIDAAMQKIQEGMAELQDCLSEY